MSFDIWLYRPKCDHCGSDPGSVYEFNLTHNVNRIVDACFVAAGSPTSVSGDSVYHNWSWGRLEGWTAKDAEPIVGLAFRAACDPANAERFRLYEPENGWGKLEDVQRVFREFHEACLTHPTTTIRVSG